jgi:hypothetical protein
MNWWLVKFKSQHCIEKERKMQKVGQEGTERQTDFVDKLVHTAVVNNYNDESGSLHSIALSRSTYLEIPEDQDKN